MFFLSVLLFEGASTVGGYVTAIDINGQGRQAFLKPDEPLRMKISYAAQNSRKHPTDTLQIILFLGDKFFKCIYNDVPPAEPDVEEGELTVECAAPKDAGRYVIRAGWGYNWPWPEDAYKNLLAMPTSLFPIGEFSVGGYAPTGMAISPVPYLVLGIPAAVLIVLGVREK